MLKGMFLDFFYICYGIYKSYLFVINVFNVFSILYMYLRLRIVVVYWIVMGMLLLK